MNVATNCLHVYMNEAVSGVLTQLPVNNECLLPQVS